MAEREMLIITRVDFNDYFNKSDENKLLEEKLVRAEADKRVLAEENKNLRKMNEKMFKALKQKTSEIEVLKKREKKANDIISDISEWLETQKRAVCQMNEVIEMCPYCGLENHFWGYDVVGHNYSAKCKRCHAEIMLCSECFESDDNKSHHCDWTEKNGCFREKEGVTDGRA